MLRYQPPVARLTLPLLLLLLLAGCRGAPLPLTGQGTAHPALVATAQADQYWRDAQATTQAYEMTVQANYQNVQSTAQAAELAQALAATRQQLELTQAQQAARRGQIATVTVGAALFLVGLLLAAILLFLLWRAVPVLLNRLSLVRYGQHGNPLLLSYHRGQTVVSDPLRMLQPALVIDEEGRVQMPELVPDPLSSRTIARRRLGFYESSESREYRGPGLPEGDDSLWPRPAAGNRQNCSGVVLLCEDNSEGGVPLPGSIPWSVLAGWEGPGGSKARPESRANPRRFG